MRDLVLEVERTAAGGGLTLADPAPPSFSMDSLDIAAARIESACLQAMLTMTERDNDVWRFLNSWMRAARSVRSDGDAACLEALFCGRALGGFLPDSHPTLRLAREAAACARGERQGLVQAAFFAGLSERRLASNVRRL